MEKRLYRSNTDTVIGGVCGGLGEYFRVDPVLVRIISVILVLVTELALVVAYIIGWIIIPRRPAEEVPATEPRYSSWHKYLPGLILIGLGAVLLIREFWRWYGLGELWPILLIVVGVGLILIKGCRKDSGSAPTCGSEAVKGQTYNGADGGTA